MATKKKLDKEGKEYFVKRAIRKPRNIQISPNLAKTYKKQRKTWKKY